MGEAATRPDFSASIICLDRAGIGTSSPDRRKTIESVVEDAVALLDHLRLADVAVFGCSGEICCSMLVTQSCPCPPKRCVACGAGGGPFATAMAVLHPDRVRSLVLVAPLAPTDRSHRDLLRGMSGADRLQLSLAPLRTGMVWGFNALLRWLAYSQPDKLLEYAPKGLAEPDGQLLRTDERVRGEFAAHLRHTFAQGSRGVAAEFTLLRRPWRFDAAAVKCRTVIWYGMEDKSIPVSHVRWYQQQIQGSELQELAGEGHISLPVKHVDAILRSGFANG
eukprot:scaffold12.g8088.t1